MNVCTYVRLLVFWYIYVGMHMGARVFRNHIWAVSMHCLTVDCVKSDTPSRCRLTAGHVVPEQQEQDADPVSGQRDFAVVWVAVCVCDRKAAHMTGSSRMAHLATSNLPHTSKAIYNERIHS